jgi:AMP-binding enzyme
MRLAAHFAALLAGAAARPAAALAELPLMSEAELFQLLVEWNDRESAPARGAVLGRAEREEWGGTVHQRVSAVAARRPQAMAVVAKRSALTYGELERRANRLAWRLRRLGVGEESLVGVCLDRDTALVTALLGVHKAGAAYLPLDPELPPERYPGGCAALRGARRRHGGRPRPVAGSRPMADGAPAGARGLHGLRLGRVGRRGRGLAGGGVAAGGGAGTGRGAVAAAGRAVAR